MDRSFINDKLNSLSKSKFRSSFNLKEKDREYIKKNGLIKIKEHAYDFVNKRLAPSIILNDGKQTPYRGHPVFVAQHATGTCCRNCLYKWHNIKPGHNLSCEEVDYVVDIIMEWLNRQYINK